MTDIELPPWTKRVGGRWMVSWQLYALGTPVTFIITAWSGLTQIPPEVNHRALLTWIGVVALACMVVGAWMIVIDRISHHRVVRPLPLPVAIAVLASFGAAFTMVLWIVAPLVGAPPLRDPLWTLVVNSTLSAWWGASVAVILDSRERLLSARSALVESAVQQELLVLHEADALVRMRDAVDAQVAAELEPVRAALEESIDRAQRSAGDGRWARVADDLRRTAHTSIRSISAALWTATEDAYARPTLMRTLLGIMRTQPLRPAAVALLYILAGTADQVVRHGILVGLVVVLVGAVGIWVILGSGNALMRRYPQHHQTVFLASMAALIVGGAAASSIQSSLTGAPLEPVDLVVALMASVVMVLATSSFGAFQRADLVQLRALAAEVDAERIASVARSRELARIAREASRVLHGQIHTRLVACAAMIDRASASGDDLRLTTAVDEARRILDEPLRHPEAPDSLRKAVEHHSSRWQEIVTVEQHIDPLVAGIGGRVAAEVSLVIEEGIANAYRHGGATSIQILISQAGPSVTVVIIDDGSGPGTDPQLGTGTAMLRQLSGGRMWLSRDARGGARLEVHLRWVGQPDEVRAEPHEPSTSGEEPSSNLLPGNVRQAESTACEGLDQTIGHQ